MILFTSDLDRTLIYSKRMMEMFPPATETIVVEHKVETAMSMMTQVTAPIATGTPTNFICACYDKGITSI